MAFSLCVCVQISHFYKDISHIELGIYLFQYDLTLMNYICSDLFPK